MYKAIFFDIDDTIFDFTACSQEALKRTCASCGIPFTGESVALFREIGKALWAEQKAGRLTVAKVLTIRAERFTGALHCPHKSALFRQLLIDNLSREAEPEPCAGETLCALAVGRKLFTASNGILEMQRARLKKAGFLEYFTAVYVSDDIGYEKPDSRFFEECLRRCKLPRQSVLMVGDSPESDIEGARRAGIDVCWYNPTGKKVPFSHCPDYEIKALPQLHEIQKLNEK